MSIVRRRTIVTAVGTALIASLSSAQASGFRLPEISIAGLGTANALVANPEELGALPYNPAAMGFQKDGTVGAGVMLIYPSTTVKTTAGSNDNEADTPFVIPNFFMSAPINDMWSFGLNINAPFGLETKYKSGTFPGFTATTPPGPIGAAAAPTVSQLKMININPNIAVKVDPTVTLAVGMDYMQVDSVKFDTAASTLKGDGYAWGWNAGLMWASGPWSAGVSYRSGASVDIDGTVKSQAVLGAKTTLELPAITQIGARFAFTPSLAVEFDIDHTEWSTFDKLKVQSTTYIPSAGITKGTMLLTSTNDWNDVTAYRVGLTWNMSQRTQLRFGYAIDDTPQEDKHFSARIPDADRQLFSFGVKQDVGDRWEWEGGVMYVLWDDRKINSSKAFTSPLQDPNGTSAYNGKYESDAWLVGLGVSKRF